MRKHANFFDLLESSRSTSSFPSSRKALLSRIFDTFIRVIDASRTAEPPTAPCPCLAKVLAPGLPYDGGGGRFAAAAYGGGGARFAITRNASTVRSSYLKAAASAEGKLC